MLTEGQILEGKYKVERFLSKGGMGAVFVGQHTHIKRKVAIKVLHAGVGTNSDTMQRFEKEAQAAGQIGSDHIVEVLDIGNTPDGDRFMVMEFLDGETLTDRIKKGGRLTPVDAVPLISQLLSGLAGAHAAGIVHRDLKPDNVFILKEKAGRKDFVKIVDFGVSKFSSLEGGAGGQTKDGAVMGTPYYMSPEQARSANEADARSDLYSVGVILYEAVTGMVPFQASTFTDLLFKIVFEQPPHPNQLVHDLDRDFATLIMTAMARDPAARFQTAQDLQAALNAWLATRGGARPGANAAPSTLVSAASGAHGPTSHRGAPSFGSASAAGPQSMGGPPSSADPRTAMYQAMPAGGGTMAASPMGVSHGQGGAGHGLNSQNGWAGAPMPSDQDATHRQPNQGQRNTGPDQDATHRQPHMGPGAFGAMAQGQGSQGQASQGQGAPAMGFDTGKAWQAANPPAPKRTGVVAVAVIAAIGLGVGAAVFLTLGKKQLPTPAATAAASADPAPAVTALPTAAPTAATPPPTAEVATNTSAIPAPSTAPSSTSQASPPSQPASPRPPSGPKPPPAATGNPTAPPRPASTVKDFGY